jgi:hypothetical protein
MRDHTALLNKSGEHVATIGFNEAYGLWQIVRAAALRYGCWLCFFARPCYAPARDFETQTRPELHWVDR